jgi:Uma2 family endonuclease
LLTRFSTARLPSEKATVRIQGTLLAPSLESAPEPDIMWLIPKDYFESHPQPEDVLLLIEVADTSISCDLGEKAKLYADAGIKDYWVVNVVDHCIDVFREPSASGYGQRHTCRANDEIQSVAFPEVSIKASALFNK